MLLRKQNLRKERSNTMAVKHIGFGGAVSKVMKSGYSKNVASAIIASASRGASKGAKKANPRLKKVASKKKK